MSINPFTGPAGPPPPPTDRPLKGFLEALGVDPAKALDDGKITIHPATDGEQRRVNITYTGLISMTADEFEGAMYKYANPGKG